RDRLVPVECLLPAHVHDARNRGSIADRFALRPPGDRARHHQQALRQEGPGDRRSTAWSTCAGHRAATGCHSIEQAALSTQQSGLPIALVLAADTNGLGALRSLRAAGIPAWVLAPSSDEIALASRIPLRKL